MNLLFLFRWFYSLWIKYFCDVCYDFCYDVIFKCNLIGRLVAIYQTDQLNNLYEIFHIKISCMEFYVIYKVR